MQEEQLPNYLQIVADRLESEWRPASPSNNSQG